MVRHVHRVKRHIVDFISTFHTGPPCGLYSNYPFKRSASNAHMWLKNILLNSEKLFTRL